MKRRKFINKAAGVAGIGALGLGGLAACQPQAQQSADCSGQAQESYDWKMVTSWPRDFPGLGTGANYFAERLKVVSGGRINVTVFGGGELVPPFEVFDTVSRGTAELGHSAPYYWKGKSPAAQFFAGVPFGFTADEQNAWLLHGGGLELWREVYSAFGLRPYPAGNSGHQAGGWFNKEILSSEDLKGLKMRIPGLGGEVLRRAGGTPQSIPGAELFTALQTGTIDATEWVGPYNDQAFGLFRAAQYYYFPGWHEPGTTLELMVNQAAYDALPQDLQGAVDVAAEAANLHMLAEFTARNGRSLNQLVNEHSIQLRQFPEEVLSVLKGLTNEVLEEIAATDELSGRVYASFRQFYETVKPWSELSELVYLNSR